MFWWIAGFFILLLVLLMFSRLDITFEYTYDQDKKSELIYITACFHRINLYRKEVDLLEVTNHSTIWKDWKEKSFLQRIQYVPKGLKSTSKKLHKQYKRTLSLLQNMQVRQFVWKTECGTGNATTTGPACGAIWAAKGMLVGVLRHKVGMAQHAHLQVIPYFQRKVITSHMHCIVSLTIGKAILAFLHHRNGKDGATEREDIDG